MSSVNKAIILGRIGRDPETRYMPDGSAVCNFSVATNETWKDKEGNKQEKTEWHNVVMYRKLAEIADKYLKSGSQVYIEGRLQTRKWQDKTSGQDRFSTEIVADEMKMLGGKSGGESGSGPTQASEEQRPSRQQAQTTSKPQSFDDDDFESDIPF